MPKFFDEEKRQKKILQTTADSKMDLDSEQFYLTTKNRR